MKVPARGIKKTVPARRAKAIMGKGKGSPSKKKSASKKPTAPATPAFDPAAPLTAESLNQNVAAATNLAYGGQQQALQGQLGAHVQATQNIPTYFADYQRALQQATNQTGAAYAAVGQQQQNTASSASALDAQQQQALNQNLQADAATRGATVDPQIAATAQQAGASRRDMLAQFSNLTGLQGAAQVAYGANRQVVGAGQKLSAQTQEAQRGRNIGVKAMDLAREKGSFAASTRQKMIDAEHTKELERKAFGLNVAKAEADVRTDAARIREAARARAARDRQATLNRRTANKNADESRAVQIARERREAAKDALQRRNRTGPYAPPGSKAANTKDAYGNTPAQRRSAQDALDKAKLLARNLPPSAKKAGVDKVAGFLAGKNTSALNARAAAEIAVNGKISPATARKLKARGAK